MKQQSHAMLQQVLRSHAVLFRSVLLSYDKPYCVGFSLYTVSVILNAAATAEPLLTANAATKSQRLLLLLLLLAQPWL